MKRTLIIITLLLSFGLVKKVSSQDTNWGIKLGGDLSTWYDSGIANTRWRMGFIAGVAWDVDFENKFHFAPELIFIQKGAAQLNQDPSGEIRDQWTMNYIEFPILGKFELDDIKGNHPFFTLGPSLSYFIGGEYRKTQDGTEVATGEVENLNRKYDFGAIAGVGIESLAIGIFEFRGQVGFVTMINASTARNATLSINFTYSFGAEKGDVEKEEEGEDRFDDKF